MTGIRCSVELVAFVGRDTVPPQGSSGTYERGRPKSAAIAGKTTVSHTLQAGRVHLAFVGRPWARLCRTAATQWKRLSLTSERLGC